MADNLNTRSDSVGQGHTPGPWAFDAGDSVVHIWDAEGCRLAVTDTKRYYQSHDETDIANARLIAAAPELLTAGVEAEWFLGHYAEYVASVPVDEIERHPYLPDMLEKLEALRAAIAKARGAT